MQLIIEKNVKFKTEYVIEDDFGGTGFNFGDYYIKYLNNGLGDKVSWQLLKRKKTVPLELNRTYDLGYVGYVNIDEDKDKVGHKKVWRYYEAESSSDEEEEEENGWRSYKHYVVDGEDPVQNTVTLSWDDKKLVFFNWSDKKNTKLEIMKDGNLVYKRDF